MITYRKTKDDRWVAFGPASEVRVGTVQVTKRDGSAKTEIVESVGKSFVVDGVPHVYGYLAARPSNGHAHNRPRRARNGECQCGACEDLLSIGYRPGQRVRCEVCGGWAEAC